MKLERLQNGSGPANELAKGSKATTIKSRNEMNGQTHRPATHHS